MGQREREKLEGKITQSANNYINYSFLRWAVNWSAVSTTKLQK